MPKGKQSGWRSMLHRHTDQGTAGGRVGPKSDVSCFQRNWVSLYASRGGISPTLRVSQSQERPSRRADMRERKKRMPRCNGGDRDCNIIPTRKRADFRMVIHCETRYRTCRMGKGQKMSRQMNGASTEAKCAFSNVLRAIASGRWSAFFFAERR